MAPPYAGANGPQAKRLLEKKQREDAMHQLAAKRKREEFEKALKQKEALAASGRRALFDKDASGYYEGSEGSGGRRQKSTPPSNGSVRTTAAPPRGRSSAENTPPEDGDDNHYPGWGRGDGQEIEPEDVEGRNAPYQGERHPDPQDNEELVEEGDGSDDGLNGRRPESEEEELEPSRFGRRAPRNEPRNCTTLVTKTARRGNGGPRGAGPLALVAEEVDDRFVMQPGRALETSVERAMAVCCLIGWNKDCDPYPSPELLVKARAMMEGMPEFEVDGVPTDPKSFLGEANYRYLMHWHTKRMSSTRGEFSGAKGIRGIFSQHEHFTPELCKTDEQVAEMKAKGEALLKDGKWHTDESGNPFSSDTFIVICNNVWRTEGCLITPKQLVWTFVVVQTLLQDKKLGQDRDVNARLLDSVGAQVNKALSAARKAKKKMALTIREVDMTIDLATATKAYLAEGGGKKKNKKNAKVEVERDPNVWANFGAVSEGEEE